MRMLSPLTMVSCTWRLDCPDWRRLMVLAFGPEKRTENIAIAAKPVHVQKYMMFVEVLMQHRSGRLPVSFLVQTVRKSTGSSFSLHSESASQRRLRPTGGL